MKKQIKIYQVIYTDGKGENLKYFTIDVMAKSKQEAKEIAIDKGIKADKIRKITVYNSREVRLATTDVCKMLKENDKPYSAWLVGLALEYLGINDENETYDDFDE